MSPALPADLANTAVCRPDCSQKACVMLFILWLLPLPTEIATN